MKPEQPPKPSPEAVDRRSVLVGSAAVAFNAVTGQGVEARDHPESDSKGGDIEEVGEFEKARLVFEQAMAILVIKTPGASVEFLSYTVIQKSGNAYGQFTLRFTIPRKVAEHEPLKLVLRLNVPKSGQAVDPNELKRHIALQLFARDVEFESIQPFVDPIDPLE